MKYLIILFGTLGLVGTITTLYHTDEYYNRKSRIIGLILAFVGYSMLIFLLIIKYMN